MTGAATINLNISGTIVWQDAPSLRAFFTIAFEGMSIKGASPMAYTLPIDKVVDVAVSYVDEKNNPVDLPQGNVGWETSDETLLAVTVDGTDDQKATLEPAGPLGNAQVTCTGHNIDGSAVVAILDVTMVAGNAVTGTIQPTGAPH